MPSKKSTVKLHSKLAKFKTAIEKRTNVSDVFVQSNQKLDYINSGSTVMNMLIGGSRLRDGSFVCPGWPRGRIVEVFGRESSGKSTVAMTAMAQAIAAEGKGNGCGLYVDLECAVVDKYAQRIGVDFRSPEQGGTGAALRAQPNTFEETEALVMTAAIQGLDLVVIDSVAGLVSEREAKRDLTKKDEKQGVAEIPRLMSQWMPKLQNVISRTGTCVMFLNQTRDKIGASPMARSEESLKSTTGGNALKFWSSIRILLRPTLSTKAKRWNPITKEHENVQIATDIVAKVIKNKVDAQQGRTGLFTIRYGVGVDELRTMLNVAEAYGIVKKVKNKRRQDVFTYRGVEEIGIEKFRLAVMHDQDLLSELLTACRGKLVEGYEMITDEELAALAEDAVTKRADDEDDYLTPEPAIEEQTEPDDEAMPDPAVETPDMESLLED